MMSIGFLLLIAVGGLLLIGVLILLGLVVAKVMDNRKNNQD